MLRNESEDRHNKVNFHADQRLLISIIKEILTNANSWFKKNKFEIIPSYNEDIVTYLLISPDFNSPVETGIIHLQDFLQQTNKLNPFLKLNLPEYSLPHASKTWHDIAHQNVSALLRIKIHDITPLLKALKSQISQSFNFYKKLNEKITPTNNNSPSSVKIGIFKVLRDSPILSYGTNHVLSKFKDNRQEDRLIDLITEKSGLMNNHIELKTVTDKKNNIIEFKFAYSYKNPEEFLQAMQLFLNKAAKKNLHLISGMQPSPGKYNPVLIMHDEHLPDLIEGLKNIAKQPQNNEILDDKMLTAPVNFSL